MANNQKCKAGTEAQNDALNAIVNKALGFPRAGTHIGNGPHVNMPPAWDGQGACPPGWTKQMLQLYVANALDSVLPMPDALVPSLQAAPAQALLSVAEQLTLATAIAARVTVDLEVGNYVPKASAVAVAATDTKGKP